MRRSRTLLALACVLGASLLPAPARTAGSGAGDAVVVAVIDNAFNPYHFDFTAAHMPQALDADPGNDLPLDQPPHTWLPGFPDPGAFAGYQALPLTVPTDGSERNSTLSRADEAAWAAVRTSTTDEPHLYWIPGTKVIGAMEWGENAPKIFGDETAHGTGTTSVSVGNLHGTCPECLLVFLGYDNTDQAEAILAWAHAQPWIDVVSNSYGINLAGPVNREPRVSSRGVTIRDQIHAGPVDAQRAASERGQTIMFSAGNGIENGFVTPHSTYTSSIKGPDWVVTVGAVDSTPPHPSYSGAGKPVDVAGVGDTYPSAYGSRTAGGSADRFSGTSNASPTVAGTYARALWLARAAMAGPSRVQSEGAIATGAYTCGAARADCELGDGVLTAEELRTRLLHGAERTGGGTTVGGLAGGPEAGEEGLLQQGHGTFLARLHKDPSVWLAEQARVTAPLLGLAPAPVRTQAERDFMVVDSYCRQQIWGRWNGGYWQPSVPLPLPEPATPVRNALHAACAGIVRP